MAQWTESAQAEVERLLDAQDISEVFAKAVGTIVEGHISAYAMHRHSEMPSCDPRQVIDFGERLLCACVDRLKRGAA